MHIKYSVKYWVVYHWIRPSQMRVFYSTFKPKRSDWNLLHNVWWWFEESRTFSHISRKSVEIEKILFTSFKQVVRSTKPIKISALPNEGVYLTNDVTCFVPVVFDHPGRLCLFSMGKHCFTKMIYDFRKSTFFNVLTKSAAAAENFPFCTIGI